MTLRDLLVIGGSLLYEPASLPAFWHAARCLPRALRQRRIIMQRRRIADDDLAAWFNFAPACRPVGHSAEPAGRKTWTAPRPVATGAETAGL